MKRSGPSNATISGERIVTSRGGFNAAFQRHMAGYIAADRLLPPSTILDLGCGTGHAYHRLAPRSTIGLDNDPLALEGQDRQVIAADMRHIPLADHSMGGVLSAHSLEHVPDPEHVLVEVTRVLITYGTAVFVTPNRLTFGKADEIIDPYHFIEWNAAELAALCRQYFRSVEVIGLFGSERYVAFWTEEMRRLDQLLRWDPLRLRRFIPRRVRQRLYDRQLTLERRDPDPVAEAISTDDFLVAPEPIDEAHDLIAVCNRPLG